MDDIAGYTLGAVWVVEQYTVFSDVPYAVFKVSLSTLSNRYDRSWRKKPFGVLLHEKKNHCCICTNLTTICAENQTLFPGNKLFTTRRNDLRPVTRGTVKYSYKL